MCDCRVAAMGRKRMGGGEGASRHCRYQPSLSNQSNRWGQPWQQKAIHKCGFAHMLPTVHDPEVII